MEKGFLFIATGHPYYVRAASRCASSIREQMAEANITIITDSDEQSFLDVFDQVLEAEVDPKRRYYSKVVNMARSPYERTIFLDADTLVLRPVGHLFGILEYFDVAMPHSFHRGEGSWYAGEALSGLPSLSSSLFVFRKNETTRQLLKTWKEKYLEKSIEAPEIGDQGILSEQIYRGTVRLYVTAPEQHFHIGLPSSAHGEIEIVTGEKKDLLNADLMNFLNHDIGFRGYLPSIQKLGFVEFVSDGRTAHEIEFEDFLNQKV